MNSVLFVFVATLVDLAIPLSLSTIVASTSHDAS